jgi:hypothetical protein
MMGCHHLGPCRDALRVPLVPFKTKIVLQQHKAPGRHLTGLHVGGGEGVAKGRGGHLLEDLRGREDDLKSSLGVYIPRRVWWVGG